MKPTPFLKRLCLLSVVRSAISIGIFIAILDRRYDWVWDTFGHHDGDVLALIILANFGTLVSTFFIWKMKVAGLYFYTLFHMIHFILLNFMAYKAPALSIQVVMFLIMVGFILGFFNSFRKAKGLSEKE